MNEFVARIGNARGEVVERPFTSASEDALRRELDQKGYYVFSVRSRSATFAGSALLSRRRRVPVREFMVFNHELATLLKAGLPLLQGLDILLERMENPLFGDILRDVRDKIKGGTALSDAFAEYPAYFPPLYATSLRAGERSGDLEGVIRRYIAYTKVANEVNKRVKAALTYPVILMSASVAVVIILLTKVVPQFGEMFATFDAELPILTRMVMHASDLMVGARWWLGIGLVAGLIGLRSAWQSERGRLAIDRYKLRLPLLGSIWQKFAVSQLTRALETLLRGGIPLVTALDVAADSVGNHLIAQQARRVVKNIREGESLSQALESTQVIQPMVIEMVRVGESTGALAEMLGNVSDYYDEDISEDMERFLTILEPALLIVMGGVVAVMLASMYLPIFELQGAIQ